MKTKILARVSAFAIILFLSVTLAYAAQGGTNTPGQGGTGTPGQGGTNTTGGGGITIPNPFNAKVGNSLFKLLQTIINDIVLPIGGVVAVLAFIYSGFLYVTAQGNETKLATAHKSLLYTAIGTAVLLGSWVLANVVCNTIHQLGGPICQTGSL